MNWRKSSYSVPNGECVELADLGDHIGLRDSKDPQGPVLTVSRDGLAELMRATKTGELDQLL